MKRNILLISAFTLLFTNAIIAQTQIENGSFETWENEGESNQEPTQWSSLKTSSNGGISSLAPQVIWKETSTFHSGNSCIRLKVAGYNWFAGVSPNALVTNGQVYATSTPSEGYVFSNTGDATMNTVCADKPDSLIGWYKYAPQGGDKGKVEILFHTNTSQGQLPDDGTTSHHVGSGLYEFTSTQSTWKRFSMPINFTTTTNPNYFLIVITAGDELDAVENSELWIDDISFVYNPVAPPPPPPTSSIIENINEFNIFSTEQTISLNVNNEFNNASLVIYSIDGKMVYTNSIESNTTVHNLNATNGIYIYKVIIDNNVYKGKININN
jgi:hypothetical protein